MCVGAMEADQVQPQLRMGYMKERQERAYSRGFGYSDKNVCASHTEDLALKLHIKNYATEEVCSFCELTGTEEEPIAAPFDDFMTAIMGAITLLLWKCQRRGRPL